LFYFWEFSCRNKSEFDDVSINSTETRGGSGKIGLEKDPTNKSVYFWGKSKVNRKNLDFPFNGLSFLIYFFRFSIFFRKNRSMEKRAMETFQFSFSLSFEH
jgi:hypothetical protein